MIESSAPIFSKYLRAPSGWWADDHVWCVEFGHGRAVPVCSCCNSGLTRHAIIDANGAVWGVDCFATATGNPRRREANAKNVRPVLHSIGRSGYHVFANNQKSIIPLSVGLSANLLSSLSKSDRARAARRMERDGLTHDA